MATALETWHEIVRTRDVARLASLLDDDVVFESPVVHTPQAGKAKALMYLQGALVVLAGDAFRYVGEWHSPNSAVLEFMTEIEGVAVDGVDLITWNEANRITHFKVMVRPLKAINKVHEKMGELLAKVAQPS